MFGSAWGVLHLSKGVLEGREPSGSLCSTGWVMSTRESPDSSPLSAHSEGDGGKPGGWSSLTKGKINLCNCKTAAWQQKCGVVLGEMAEKSPRGSGLGKQE